jgi:hypothetical protein
MKRDSAEGGPALPMQFALCFTFGFFHWCLRGLDMLCRVGSGLRTSSNLLPSRFPRHLWNQSLESIHTALMPGHARARLLKTLQTLLKVSFKRSVSVFRQPQKTVDRAAELHLSLLRRLVKE